MALVLGLLADCRMNQMVNLMSKVKRVEIKSKVNLVFKSSMALEMLNCRMNLVLKEMSRVMLNQAEEGQKAP